MADKIRLEVVTPESEIFNDLVDSFTLPIIDGRAGVLCNHAPMLAALETGVIVYNKDGKPGCIAISNGFLEVKNNEAKVLASTAELAEDIDVERAKASMERAKQRLTEKANDTDSARAAASLSRAMARLNATEYLMESMTNKK